MVPSGKVYTPVPWYMLFWNSPSYTAPEGCCNVPRPCIWVRREGHRQDSNVCDKVSHQSFLLNANTDTHKHTLSSCQSPLYMMPLTEVCLPLPVLILTPDVDEAWPSVKRREDGRVEERRVQCTCIVHSPYLSPFGNMFDIFNSPSSGNKTQKALLESPLLEVWQILSHYHLPCTFVSPSPWSKRYRSVRIAHGKVVCLGMFRFLTRHLWHLLHSYSTSVWCGDQTKVKDWTC